MVSTQVLHEYAAAALKKLKLADDVVLARIELFSRFEVVAASVTALKAALALRALHRLSFWDSLIVQAARDAGCAALLSEDLAEGATLAGVTIVNPFSENVPVGKAARRKPRRPSAAG